MDTPHNDKQRKSLFPYKLAQTLVGLIAVCFLIFCIRSPSTSSPSPFQTTSSEKETALKWIFITPYGETDSSYANLFLSQEDCTELAGTPVELSFCTIEKYLNMTASGISADVVTCWYTDANFKRLETTGTTWALQDLLDKENSRLYPARKLYPVVRKFSGRCLRLSTYRNHSLGGYLYQVCRRYDWSQGHSGKDSLG